MDYQGFKSYIEGVGLSYGNRYEVQIAGLSEEACALAAAVELQTPSFDTFKWVGQKPFLNMPYEIKFEPITISFYTADDGTPYNELWEWQKSITDDEWNFNDYTSYVRDIQIRELSREGAPIGTHHYINAFPLSLGTKTLAYENGKAVNKFGVIFAYEIYDFEG